MAYNECFRNNLSQIMSTFQMRLIDNPHKFHSHWVLDACASHTCECIGERKCNTEWWEILPKGKCKMKILSYKKTEYAFSLTGKMHKSLSCSSTSDCWSDIPHLPFKPSLMLVKLNISSIFQKYTWQNKLYSHYREKENFILHGIKNMSIHHHYNHIWFHKLIFALAKQGLFLISQRESLD